jgi:hypothetical protein
MSAREAAVTRRREGGSEVTLFVEDDRHPNDHFRVGALSCS